MGKNECVCFASLLSLVQRNFLHCGRNDDCRQAALPNLSWIEVMLSVSTTRRTEEASKRQKMGIGWDFRLIKSNQLAAAGENILQSPIRGSLRLLPCTTQPCGGSAAIVGLNSSLLCCQSRLSTFLFTRMRQFPADYILGDLEIRTGKSHTHCMIF